MKSVLCVGHASYDITMSVTHHPDTDEKTSADSLSLSGGGPAANAAVCICKLGGNATFLGQIGNDALGELHIRELIDSGVDTRWIFRCAHSTVSQILAKPDSSRSVVNFQQHSFLSKENPLPDISDFSALLIDGHEPLISLQLARKAKQYHIPVILDGGSVRTGTRELLPYIDYLAVSEKFARQWTNQTTGIQHLHDQLNTLSLYSPNTMITLGSRGLIWRRGSETGALTAFPINAIDSTGAGDAFHGALAYAVAHDTDWLDALAFASAAGALTCTRLGARPALPTMSEIQSLLEQHYATHSG